MMSYRVWLSGPMVLLGGLCLWSHVPSVGSLSRGGSVQGGLWLGVSVQRAGGNPVGGGGGGPCKRDPHMVKSRQHASYWNAFLLIFFPIR